MLISSWKWQPFGWFSHWLPIVSVPYLISYMSTKLQVDVMRTRLHKVFKFTSCYKFGGHLGNGGHLNGVDGYQSFLILHIIKHISTKFHASIMILTIKVNLAG